MAVMRKVISGEKLCANNVTEINFNFGSNYNSGRTLLKGRVVSYYGKPINKAAVEVTVFDESYWPHKKVFHGVTFSLENGEFGISLPYKENYSIKFTAYC